MPVQSIIDIGFNYKKTESEKIKVLEYLKEVRDSIKDLNGMNFNGGSLSGLMKNEEQLAKVQEQLNKVTADYLKVQEQLSKQSATNANTVKSTAEATNISTKSFTQNSVAVEENIAKQKELKKELESIADSRKQLNDFNSKVNFDNNDAAKEQIEKQLLDFSERELQIKKQIAELNTQLKGDAVSAPNHFQGNDTDENLKTIIREREEKRLYNAELKSQVQLELATVGSINEAKAAVSVLTKERDNLNLTTEEGVQRQQELNKKLDEYNAFIKVSVDRQSAQRLNVGNYPILTGQIGDLIQEYNKLSDAEKNAASGQALFEQINTMLPSVQQHLESLTKSFSKLSESEKGTSIGQQLEEQINSIKSAISGFGTEIKASFASAFTGAFNTLKEELANVKQQLADPALSGKQLESLQNQERLLAQLTENLGHQFTSTREELRAYQEAAKQLGISLGDDNKLFQEFAASVGDVKDEVNDLQAHINFNASDTKYLDGAIEAVNGLAGAYSAAEGAVQLFGDENQDVQRGMQKLQALIAITTGLQQVQNALQSESAAMQTILAVKTNLLAAARGLLNTRLKEDTAAIVADTAAQEANTAAIVANTTAAEGAGVAGATEEDVSILDAAATAQEQLSTATETVGTATEAVTTIREAAAPITEANTAATEAETAADSQNAIVKLVLLARAKLLAAAKALLGRATAQNAAATEAEAAAQAAATAAAGAQVTANTELAASAEGASAAMGTETAATEAATAATVTFAEAFAATGIGALILAVGAALVYAAVKLKDWISAEKDAYDANVKVTASIKDQSDVIQKQTQLIDERNKANLTAIQNENTLAEAAGQNREKQFEQQAKLLRQLKEIAQSKLGFEIAEAEKEYSESGVKGIEALNLAQTGYLSKYRSYVQQIKIYQKQLDNAILNKDDDAKNEAEGRIADLQKQADAAKSAYDRITTVIDNAAKVDIDIRQQQLEHSKYNAEEERKLTLATTEIEVANIKSRNDLILSDTQSTFEQRRKAIQSNADADMKLAKAQLNDVLSNPASSNNDKLTAEKQFGEKRVEVARQSHDKLDAVTEEENKRLITADKSMYDTRIKAMQDFYTKASQNPNLSFQQQIAAFDKVQALQQQQIIADHEADEKIKNQSFRTNEERAADEAAFQQQLSDLAQNGADKRLKFIEAYNQKVQQETLEANNALKNAIQSVYVSDAETSEQYTQDVEALNNSLHKKEISLREYNNRRKQLDDDYAVYSLSSQIAKDKKELAIVKHGTQEELVLRQKVADEEKQLADKQLEQYKQALQERNDLEKEFVNDVVNLGQTIGDAGFQKKIDSYERLKKASDDYYSREIQNIAESARIGAVTDQQAADRTTVLNAEKQAAADQLDRKEREIKIKQARFDKAASIAGIIAKAAQAEIAATSYLSNPLTAPLYPAIAALIAATASVQIATVLATPIPQFKTGTKNAPEGYAVVGEEGRELRIEPTGEMTLTPEKASVTYLKQGTQIIPHQQTEDYLKRIKPLPPIKTDDVNTMMNRSMIVTTAKLLQVQEQQKNSPVADDRVLKAINNQTRQFVKALKSNKTSVHIHDNSAFIAWKKSRTNW